MGTRIHRTTRSRASGSCSARTCECASTRTPARSSATGTRRPMLEALLGASHPRWQAYTEVAVHRPSRGWIDAVLHEPRDRVAVAPSSSRSCDGSSSWSGGPQRRPQACRAGTAGRDSATSRAIERLLIVRRTRATRAWPPRRERQLRVAYPAHPDDALAALDRNCTVSRPGARVGGDRGWHGATRRAALIPLAIRRSRSRAPAAMSNPRTLVEKIWDDHVVAQDAGRAGRPRRRPAPRPRGHQPAGVHRAARARARRPPPGQDRRDRGPLDADHAARPADRSTCEAAAADQPARDELRASSASRSTRSAATRRASSTSSGRSSG